MAVVVRHGDNDAGAIYIRINHLDGTSALYGPAPAGFSDGDSERRWSPCLASAVAADDAVEAYLERQARSDPLTLTSMDTTERNCDAACGARLGCWSGWCWQQEWLRA